MVIVFASFAIIAGLISLLMPHWAGGLGVEMMRLYLLLGLIAAVLGLIRPRKRR